jgi:C-terminal processing protease CtpA/Prc
VLLQSQAKMLTFNRGILMWVMDGKVYSFTAFRKEAVGQPTNGFGVAGRAGQQGHHGGQPTSGIIGAALKRQDDHYVVLGVFPGSPAAAAGLKEGDQLLQVDGQAVKADFEEIAKRIGGPAGTVVKLKVRKADGNEVELAITRRELPYP